MTREARLARAREHAARQRLDPAFRAKEAASKRRYRARPESQAKERAYQQQYDKARWADPEVRARRRNAQVAAKYGISLDEAARLAAQAHCEVCDVELSWRGSTKRCLDHCHTTSRIRGVLCSRCNLAIGQVNDAPKRLIAIAAYLDDRAPLMLVDSPALIRPEVSWGGCPKKERCLALRLADRYGIEPTEAMNWIKRTQKRCDACGAPPGKRSLCIDHCHRQHRVRGVLCHHCNFTIGLVDDSPARLRALAAYLGRAPQRTARYG